MAGYHRANSLFLLVLATQLVAIGCNSGPDLPPLAKVSGTITYEGQPLPRGTVQFVPNASRSTTGPTATAVIGPAGTYQLTTAGEPGAMVGWHRVRIVSQQEPRDETDTDPASLIPARYNRPETSELEIEVMPVEMNVINLELEP